MGEVSLETSPKSSQDSITGEILLDTQSVRETSNLENKINLVNSKHLEYL